VEDAWLIWACNKMTAFQAIESFENSPIAAPSTFWMERSEAKYDRVISGKPCPRFKE
jgi:hypothetical protein